MEKTFDIEQLGEVVVRNIIIDTDGTNLEEGIEITCDLGAFELGGFIDLDDLTEEQIYKLLENYYGKSLHFLM